MTETRDPAGPASRPAHRQPALVALVTVGGAAGALARYALSELFRHHGSYPWPVLLINGVGAFALGLLLEALTRSGPDVGGRRRLRLFLGTGFCGAFTTYSTFAHDVVSLGHHGAAGAAGWAVGEVIVGLVLAAAGAWVGARTSNANGPAR